MLTGNTCVIQGYVVKKENDMGRSVVIDLNHKNGIR